MFEQMSMIGLTAGAGQEQLQVYISDPPDVGLEKQQKGATVSVADCKGTKLFVSMQQWHFMDKAEEPAHWHLFKKLQYPTVTTTLALLIGI